MGHRWKGRERKKEQGVCVGTGFVRKRFGGISLMTLERYVISGLQEVIYGISGRGEGNGGQA